ncbi:hypothetical protein [Paracoccus saliphilus]|uniref:Uncharacterized protein n=1 Tax=Paracoccus saliphilus TaxID=405559 RepID=A0AA45W622_9RHOB|nr:hypothetical protein [Paracoccus saliphilus]WCR01649.1 hypothetical protein JHX88_11965 [Paracoccus saliphilus]SIS98345.1 hypothetical protein SAMN05421772_11122 [Paracoccus saliphilus]
MKRIALLATLLIPTCALAETTAFIQKNVEGQNQIGFLNTMPDGREVMLAISCPIDEPMHLAGALDLEAAPPWNPLGERVTFNLDGLAIEREMVAFDQYLVLPTGTEDDMLRGILKADNVSITVQKDINAEFSLTEALPHIEAFRSLCTK